MDSLNRTIEEVEAFLKSKEIKELARMTISKDDSFYIEKRVYEKISNIITKNMEDFSPALSLIVKADNRMLCERKTHFVNITGIAMLSSQKYYPFEQSFYKKFGSGVIECH